MSLNCYEYTVKYGGSFSSIGNLVRRVRSLDETISCLVSDCIAIRPFRCKFSSYNMDYYR